MPLGRGLLRALTFVGFSVFTLICLCQSGLIYTWDKCLLAFDQATQEGMSKIGDAINFDDKKIKVDMEVFVMSRCPDAQDAEITIAEVMQEVGRKISLNFTYIATLRNTSKGTIVECKHGPTECLGNRQQLCFQKYHPNEILAFISCLNRTPSQIGNSLSYTLHCADRAGVDDYASIIQPCADTAEGFHLSIDSAARCELLNTHTSATIRVSGKNICQYDGGEWKECKEPLSQGGGNVALGLQTIIEKEWKRINEKELFWQLDG